MPNDKKAPLFALLTLFAVSFGLVAYEMTIMKFMFDEPNAIELGMRTVAADFMVTHGKQSVSSHLFFPPGFAWFMGALVLMTDNPKLLSWIVALISQGAIVVLFIYYRRSLPGPAALLAAAALAVNPVFVITSHNLWEPSPQIPLVALLYFFLDRFLREEGWVDFVIAVALVSIAAQAYLTGVFLYAPLAVIALLRWRSIGVKGFAAATGLALVISWPYLSFLLGGALQSSLGAISARTGGQEEGTLLTWLLLGLRFHAGAPSIYELTFFLDDLRKTIAAMAGPLGAPLYWASLLLSLSFIVGQGAYLVWVILRRRLFDPRDERFPLPFQIAGFVSALVVVEYIVVRTPPYFQYFIILFPFYPVLAAWPLYRLWRFRFFRPLLFLPAAATGLLLLLILIHTKGQNSWFAFGVSYAGLEKIREEIWAAVPEGTAPQVYVNGGLYPRTVWYSYRVGKETEGKPKSEVTLALARDEVDGVYRWRVESIAGALAAYRRGLDDVAARIPAGAQVAAHDEWNHARAAFAADMDYHMPNRDTPYQRLASRPGVKRYPDGAGEAEYIVLSSGDPRQLYEEYNDDDRKEVTAWLLDRRYGLVSGAQGLYLFQKGAPPFLNRAAYEKVALRFTARQMAGLTGWLRVDWSVDEGKIRAAAPPSDPQGHLAFGPYVRLLPGGYEAHFRLKMAGTISGEEIGVIDVAGRKGMKIYTARKLTGADFGKSGLWREFSLPFTIKGEEDEIEFRLFYEGVAGLAFDQVRVTMSDDAFARMMR